MNSSYLTSFSPVRLKERQLLLLLLCAFEFPCCHKPGKHRGEESTWSSNISDGFDGVTLVLGESQKTTVKKIWKHFGFKLYCMLLLQNILYNSLHENATLKYLVVSLFMCIITKKLS